MGPHRVGHTCHFTSLARRKRLLPNGPQVPEQPLIGSPWITCPSLGPITVTVTWPAGVLLTSGIRRVLRGLDPERETGDALK